MKKIEICEKIAPFSHRAATECVVPLSDWVVTAYPAMLSVAGIQMPIEVTGPVEQFLVQMDLERDCVWVSGIAKEGHYRFRLSAEEAGLCFTVDRCPKQGIVIGSHRLQRKSKVLIASGGRYVPRAEVERISLGNWKAQEWDLVCRRNEPKEIVPALYLLGQKTPIGVATHGTAALLGPQKSLKPFFLTAFSGILVPHLKDVLHQGIAPKEVGTGDPISLLSMSTRLIRSFLIEETHILPHLPKDWVAGRALSLRVSNVARIDLEWTKGLIRRMIVHVTEDCSIPFLFSKEIKTFRCDGKLAQNGETLSFRKGKTLLDRFQK